MIVGPVSVFTDLIGFFPLTFFREIVKQQGNDTFGTFNKFGRIQSLVKMVLHVLHFAVHVVLQVIFKTRSLLLKKFSLGDTT
jgi:hypothetical protein